MKPDHEDYRDSIAAGWQAIGERPGERFLLVIDGADEASGPWLETRLLPYRIPANLVLVLAARHRPDQTDGRTWLEAFPVAPECRVAEPLELEPLDRDAVGEAIVQLGHPLDDLPGRDGVLDALYTLTDRGDPLLVSLWVGQLWKSREQAETLNSANLERLQPGYDGFVDVWLKEQSAVWRGDGIATDVHTLRCLLRVLSVARGPLRLRDWLAVVGHLPSALPCDDVTARKVLDNAHRLIVGNKDSGYTFVHPRLADHFQAELETIKEERRVVPRAYLDWGATTVAALNDSSLSADQCPSYLLRHYTSHVLSAALQPAQMLDEHLLAILGEGWMHAHEEEEGAYRTYLMDVSRVRKALRQTNQISHSLPSHLGGEIRCALIASSIRSLNEHLEPSLIAELIETGTWTIGRALRVAQELPNELTRAQMNILLSESLTGMDRMKVLTDALRSAQHFDSSQSRTEILKAAVPLLGNDPILLGEALSLACGIADEQHRIAALLMIVQDLAEQPLLLERARDEVTRLSSSFFQICFINDVSRALPQTEPRPAISEAMDSVEKLDDPRERALALCLLANFFRSEKQEQIIDRAFEAAHSIEKKGERFITLMQLAYRKNRDKRRECFPAILRASEDIDKDSSRDTILLQVASYLFADPPLIPEALACSDRISDSYQRSLLLAEISKHSIGQRNMSMLLRQEAGEISVTRLARCCCPREVLAD